MSEKLPQVNLLHGKSFLRVRGFAFMEEEISQVEEQLAHLVEEARLFFAECKRFQFVYSVTYIRNKIKYIHVPAYDLNIHHIPLMVFSYWDESNKRREVFDWENIQSALDEANVSLDERLLHMRIFFSFKDFYYRGRAIACKLKTLYSLKHEIHDMMSHEKMSLKMMPDFMMYSLGEIEQRRKKWAEYEPSYLVVP